MIIYNRTNAFGFQLYDVTCTSIQSFDPKYEQIPINSTQLQILVFDDEYCDPSFCVRGGQPLEVREREYEDTYQTVKVCSMNMYMLSYSLIIVTGNINPMYVCTNLLH